MYPTQQHHQQNQQEQQQLAGGAQPPAASSAMQHTRHTKRTPIPSVRLQRIMEGDAHASGSHAGGRSRAQHAHQQPRKRSSGSKRSAEAAHEQLQQAVVPGHASSELDMHSQQCGGRDSQRVKAPRLVHAANGSSASASVSATPEPALMQGASLFGGADPNPAAPAFVWPDEGAAASLLPDEGSAWGAGASFGAPFARAGSSSSSVAVLPGGIGGEADLLGGGMPGLEAGMSVSAPAGFGMHGLTGGLGGVAAAQQDSRVHGSAHSLWLPGAAGVNSTNAGPHASCAGGSMALLGGCSLEDGLHDMHVTTDLLVSGGVCKVSIGAQVKRIS